MPNGRERRGRGRAAGLYRLCKPAFNEACSNLTFAELPAEGEVRYRICPRHTDLIRQMAAVWPHLRFGSRRSAFPIFHLHFDGTCSAALARRIRSLSHFKGPNMKTDLRNSILSRFEVTDFAAIAAIVTVVIFAIGH